MKRHIYLNKEYIILQKEEFEGDFNVYLLKWVANLSKSQFATLF